MSNLSKEQRDKLPLDSFGDPQRRLFPIVDQADVDSAAHLIGKAKNPGAVKARIIAICTRKKLSVPDAWKASMSTDGHDPASAVATFGVEGSGRYVDGDYAIYPNSLLFEAGDYADKAFTLSPEEQWAAVESFAPVWGNIEHTDFLKGRACEVRSIRLDEGDSHTLRGEVAVPLWLDENLGDEERRLSCEWDRDAKTLLGIGLVVHPRLPDAALMAAFTAYAETHLIPPPSHGAQTPLVSGGISPPFDTPGVFAGTRHDTPIGQAAIQELHDTAVRAGAVCRRPSSGRANMASAHESKAVQAIHDTAMQHGAVCASVTQPPNGGNPWPVSAANSLFSAVKDGSMTIKEFFMGMKEAGIIEDSEETVLPPIASPTAEQAPPAAVATTAPFTAIPVADYERLKAERLKAEREKVEVEFAAAKKAQDETAAKFAALQSENARLKAEGIQKTAESEAEKLIVAHKADPVERESIVAAFTQAATDDTVYGVVTFSAADGTDAKTTRVDQLKAIFAARTAHERNVELVPDHEGKDGAAFTIKNPQTTPQAGQEKPLTEAEAQRLIGMMTKHGRPVAATFNSGS